MSNKECKRYGCHKERASAYTWLCPSCHSKTEPKWCYNSDGCQNQLSRTSEKQTGLCKSCYESAPRCVNCSNEIRIGDMCKHCDGSVHQASNTKCSRENCNRSLVLNTEKMNGYCYYCRNYPLRSTPIGERDWTKCHKSVPAAGCKLAYVYRHYSNSEEVKERSIRFHACNGLLEVLRFGSLYYHFGDLDGKEVWVDDKKILPEDYGDVELHHNSTIILKLPSEQLESLQENAMQTRKFGLDQVRAEVSKARTAVDKARGDVDDYNNSLSGRLQSETAKAFDPEATKYTNWAGKDVEFRNDDPQARLNEVASAFPRLTAFLDDDWVDTWERKLDALVGDTIELTDSEFEHLVGLVNRTVSQAESTSANAGA